MEKRVEKEGAGTPSSFQGDLGRFGNCLPHFLSPKKEEIVEKGTHQEIKEYQSLFNLVCFSKYPYFVRISRKDKRTRIIYKGEERGEKVEWEVISIDKLPGEIELKVWIWFLEEINKIKKTNKEIPEKIPYSIYKIREYWNMPDSGRVFRIIQEAIENLRDTTINYVVCDKNGKEIKKLRFSVFGSVYARGTKGVEGKVFEEGVIEINPAVKQMIESGFLRPNCLETWKKLSDANLLASNLYEILSYIYFFTKKKTIDFWYDEIVEKLALIPQEHLSSIKRQFEKAEKILKEEKIIEKLEINEIIDGTKRKVRFKFYVGEKLKKEVESFKKISNHKITVKELKTQLDEENLKKEVSYWSEIISEKLEISPDDLQFLLRKIIKDNHDRNYSDLLYRAISETKMYAPGNKKAYLISLLTKYFFKEN